MASKSPNLRQFSQHWTIDHFSYHFNYTTEVAEYPSMKSTNFPGSSDNCQPKFRMELYPKGNSEDNGSYLAIYLELVSFEFEKYHKLNINVSISLIGANNYTFKTMEAQFKFSSLSNFGWPKYISHQEILCNSGNLLPDDKLTLLCKITYLCEKKTNDQQGNCPFTLCQRCHGGKSALEDFGKLFESKKLSDVILVVDDTEFQTHKCILGARSSVFAAMFQQKMGTVDKRFMITDVIEVHAFEQFLRYIYTGKVHLMDSIANELLVLSNKYAVGGLKSLCEKYLTSKLSYKSALNILMLADINNAENLKNRTIEYIRPYTRLFMCTEDWRSIIINKPALAKDVMSKVLVGFSLKCTTIEVIELADD